LNKFTASGLDHITSILSFDHTNCSDNGVRMESTNDQPATQHEEMENGKGYDATSLDTRREDEGKTQFKDELPEKASSAPADAEPEKIDRMRRLILVMTLTLACFLVTLDASIIVTVG
jgi:hypothetical protein